MSRQLYDRQMLYAGIIIILNQRIEELFLLPEKVRLAFISFVFHGLLPADRIKVIKSVHQNLLPGGQFCIFDYTHFVVNS